MGRELESAGYLSRTRRSGADGRWIWEILFCATAGGLPASWRSRADRRHLPRLLPRQKARCGPGMETVDSERAHADAPEGDAMKRYRRNRAKPPRRAQGGLAPPPARNRDAERTSNHSESTRPRPMGRGDGARPGAHQTPQASIRLAFRSGSRPRTRPRRGAARVFTFLRGQRSRCGTGSDKPVHVSHCSPSAPRQNPVKRTAGRLTALWTLR